MLNGIVNHPSTPWALGTAIFCVGSMASMGLGLVHLDVAKKLPSFVKICQRDPASQKYIHATILDVKIDACRNIHYARSPMGVVFLLGSLTCAGLGIACLVQARSPNKASETEEAWSRMNILIDQEIQEREKTYNAVDTDAKSTEWRERLSLGFHRLPKGHPVTDRTLRTVIALDRMTLDALGNYKTSGTS